MNRCSSRPRKRQITTDARSTWAWTLPVCAILAATSPINAEDFKWVAGSGSWSTRTNWSPPGIPNLVSDTVTIRTGNKQPFTIDVDFAPQDGGPILLGGLVLNDSHATLRPVKNNAITVLNGRADLLRGHLALNGRQTMQIGIRSGTLSVGDARELTGPATFLFRGQKNLFNPFNGKLAANRTLQIRGLGAKNPGHVFIPVDKFFNHGTVVMDSVSSSEVSLQIGDGTGQLLNFGMIQPTLTGRFTGPMKIMGHTTNYGIFDLTNQTGGMLQIQGDLIQKPESTLSLELAGSSSDDIDTMSVTGTAHLAGTLDLQFIDQFVPKVGESMQFLAVTGGLNGTFDAVGDLTQFLDSGIGVRIEYLNPQPPGTARVDSSVIISGHDCGDANGDGGILVDEFDLFEILSNWNDVLDAGVLPDMNGDSTIGLADLNQVLTNFVKVGSAPVVPEPTILGLLAAVAAIGCRRHRSIEF